MTQTRRKSGADAPKRSISTRRVAFDPALEPMDRHWINHDMLLSHVLAVFSAGIPLGEDFVIDAVRAQRPNVTDADLKAQMGSFIGQETVHEREHGRLNAALTELGYPVEAIEQDLSRVFAVLSRISPPSLKVGITVAIEHFTSLLAEEALGRDIFDRLDVPKEVVGLLNWHLFEELEHRAIAIDTLRATGGSEADRVLGMLVLLTAVFPVLGLAFARSLVNDPATRNPLAIIGNLRKVSRWPFSGRRLALGMLEYFRPGFHPDDNNLEELTEKWRTELFGPDGSLTDRLPRSGSKAVATAS